ncbi:DUF4136 domain-containing protein [Alteromonas sp. C1M14]|uniref:DUF4136 domain-containing protein n=1 Tax=Alteromonas sp. C1M14 TaxID=2841567 RepID=UPI001C0A668F|nr:DUF4136 domain-containing protein [Alteromonas sp. C1M14]MBU2979615.1 DUF4136 domain-containing protein [Alteromonas sp. C1M14]
MKIQKPVFKFAHPTRCILLSLLTLFIISGCASRNPQVAIDQNQDFSQLHTFYVRPPLNSVNPQIESQLITAITGILEQKGYSSVSQDSADMQVGFQPSTSSQENGTRLNLGLGTGLFGRSGGISLGSIFSIPVGEQVTDYQALQIDVVTGNTFIYSAAGSAKLSSRDAITVQNKLNELIDQLLEDFPEATYVEPYQ